MNRRIVRSIKRMPMHFRRVTESDFPTLTEWLNRRPVAQWWDDCTTLAQVREMYLPCLSSDSSVVPYFACLDDVPIGYIQSYVAASGMDGGPRRTTRGCAVSISSWPMNYGWAKGWALKWSASLFSSCFKVRR